MNSTITYAPVPYNGRMCQARIERLANGLYRADQPNGLVSLYRSCPANDPQAIRYAQREHRGEGHQHHARPCFLGRAHGAAPHGLPP